MTTAFTVDAMTATPEEQARLLRAVRDAIREAEELRKRAKTVRKDAVEAAMDAGVPAQDIADYLGVNRSYVYQMRQGK